MRHDDTSVIICCAGMGTRLGISSTKALINVDGKTIIQRLLELLKEYDDVRIVVGYQAEKIIEEVNEYRNDVMYAFNYDYEHTDVGDSIEKALLGARKYSLIIDGDIVIHPDDYSIINECTEETIFYTKPSSSSPVFLNVNDGKAIGFDLENGKHEWCGIAKIETAKLVHSKKHAYEMIEGNLPVKATEIRVKDIDTPEDYENMIEWIQNNYQD